MYPEDASAGRSAIAVTVGIALGAGVMFMLDPRSGRRRRSLLVGRTNRGLRKGREFARKVGTDARNRTAGIYHQARSAVHREATGAEDSEATRDPAEQREPFEPEYLQENWSPAPRVFAGALGLGLLASGLGARRASLASAALSAAGAAILLRAASNRPLSRLISFGADAEEGFMIQKALDVNAGVDEVYAAWRSLESFPTFMSHVREVNPIGERRYQWVVDGPAGVPVTWEAEITEDIPNELIAWRTVAGAPVQSSGVVRFQPTDNGGTRIQVRMWYRPPANVVGHAAALMFARDPRHQIEDDLLRFKSFLETGKTTGSQGTVLRH